MTSLSIGITAHSEGIVLHKTLLSIQQAIKSLEEAGLSFEIILQLDKPTAQTLRYVEQIPSLFPDTAITKNISDYGNPAQARNDIVSLAKGTFITFIDGDDLITSNWLIDAYLELKKHQDEGQSNYIAHPEVVIEFESAHAVVNRVGEIDKDSDSLLSVFANRWNVVLMIERRFLIDHPYPHGDGYGFEDWYINCLTIFNDYHNVLIPKTALFVRRKASDSVWSTHKSSFTVLPANPLLGFNYIRSIKSPFVRKAVTFDNSIKNRLKQYELLRKVGRRLYRLRDSFNNQAPYTPPEWLREAWTQQHTVDKNIFYAKTPEYYESITPEHYEAAIGYKEIVDSLSHDAYDYIFFIPWVIKGGADLFAVNYANTIADSNPDKQVLVITTTPSDSPWESKLNSNVDFVEFGKITKSFASTVKSRLLEQLVENSHASHIHVINSEVGYDFIASHASYLKGTKKKVIATSFSQSTDDSGRIFGYSHTHVPLVYSLLDHITTDNEAVRNMWISEYGFDPKIISVHNQPVAIPQIKKGDNNTPKNTIRILWAARLSPEKQPKLVVDIAKQLSDLPVEFHMFGQPDEDFDTSFLASLPGNLKYHGGYDGFSSLNPSSYDLYLYTSLFDGMPNSVLEAGSYGLPIVASSVGGLPNLIRSGESGILVDDLKNASDYANVLRDIISNPTLLSTFGEAIRDKIEREFSRSSYEASVKKMLTETKYL